MMISGPFFSVFMLRDLQFSYVAYTIVSAASTVAILVFLPFWGRRADRAGNLKIIKITSFLMPVVPLLWVLNGNPIYLLATNVVSGFTWSGFNLASVNFVYDASEPGSRTKQIAVFNSITCVALCLGALLGGYLVPHLPKTLGFQLRTLFIVSGAFRAVIALLLLRTIFEVRRVSKIDTVQLMLGRSGANDKGTNGEKPGGPVK
jgi:MFS family permease